MNACVFLRVAVAASLLFTVPAGCALAQAHPIPTTQPLGAALSQQNKHVVERFYAAVEAQRFDVIRDVFAPTAQQLLPYAPAGFPTRLDGAEAIYKQFSGLTTYFNQFKFPRQVLTTEDPNFIFVKFTGELTLKSGGQYANDYVGTFRLQNGKIVEYVEYFNPILMAKAFGLKL